MRHHFSGHFGSGGKSSNKSGKPHNQAGFDKSAATGSLADDMAIGRLGSSYSMNAKPFAQGQAVNTAKPAKIDQKVVDSGGDDHAIAHSHLDNAKKAGTTDEKRTHVFSALTALNALRRKKPLPGAGETGAV